MKEQAWTVTQSYSSDVHFEVLVSDERTNVLRRIFALRNHGPDRRLRQAGDPQPVTRDQHMGVSLIDAIEAETLTMLSQFSGRYSTPTWWW